MKEYAEKFVLIPKDKLDRLTSGHKQLDDKKENKEAEEVETEKDYDTLTNEDILQTFSKSSRNKARNLLQFLKRSKGFSFDSSGQVILNGEVIQASHIVDLLKYVLYNFKSFTPPGAQEFVNYLNASRIPRTLWRSDQRGFGNNPIPPPGIPPKKKKRTLPNLAEKKDTNVTEKWITLK